ncbi:MAG: hypothetical protein JNL05_04490 [Flavobacteriales bacterium]|nr:hypothetical protein [Flavobacteriales bacterium]
MKVPNTVRHPERFIKQGEFATSDLTFRKFYWSLLQQAIPTLEGSNIQWVFMLRTSWSKKALNALALLIRKQWWWLMERLPSNTKWAMDELGSTPIGESYHVTFTFYKDGSSDCIVLLLSDTIPLKPSVAFRQTIRWFNHNRLSKRALVFPLALGQHDQ